MCDMDHVLKDIYTSDTILSQDEEMMLEQVHIRYFDFMDHIHERMIEGKVTLTDEEIVDLEDCVNDFAFEYGFIQFKRGIHLATAIEHA